MMNILYVHGLGGHENGNASNLVKEELQKRCLNFNLYAPQFPVTNPESMKHLLTKYSKDSDFVVASSLGAFHSIQIDGVSKVLINPALPDNLEQLKDEQITPELLDQLYKEKDLFLNKVRRQGLKDEIYIILGNKDNVAPNNAFFKSVFDQYDSVHFININMGHKMEHSGAVAICDILEEHYK